MSKFKLCILLKVTKVHLKEIKMLKQLIKSNLITAMKEKNETKKNIYRVVLGEIDTLESRQVKPLSDEGVAKVIRKVVQNNKETLFFVKDNSAKETLNTENDILESLLPKTLTTKEIEFLLTELKSKITDANNEGQAIGIAMKFLKEKQAIVNGEDVKTIVASIRNTSNILRET